MNPQIIFGAIGALAVILIIINLFKRRSVKQFLEANEEVPQLYLQKAVENKVRTLNQTLRQSQSAPVTDEDDNEIDMQEIAVEFNQLKESYKAQQLSLKAYNAKLDKLISRIN